jgi:hypothetical protein
MKHEAAPLQRGTVEATGSYTMQHALCTFCGHDTYFCMFPCLSIAYTGVTVTASDILRPQENVLHTYTPRYVALPLHIVSLRSPQTVQPIRRMVSSVLLRRVAQTPFFIVTAVKTSNLTMSSQSVHVNVCGDNDVITPVTSGALGWLTCR